MAEEPSPLKLLDDLPVGTDDDRFQHSLYAETLAAVFSSGIPGMCVALFGKWGQGKSTVVRLLKERLEGSETRVLPFNAWKSSGDSLRRQLLLQVMSVVAPEKAGDLKRFVGIDVVRDLLLSPGERRAERARGVLKLLANGWIWLKFAPLLAMASGFFVAAGVLVYFALFQPGSSPDRLLTVALALLLPSGLFLWAHIRRSIHRKLLGYLPFGEPVSESQKIRYPEQFKELFTQHVSSWCSKHGRLIVVIDDLDRCDADTVAEALAAIRQFTPDELSELQPSADSFQCRFLVPCDETQVALALESAGHDAGTEGARFHDYQNEELLRKFFDVTIRMHEMMPSDLSEYAASLGESIGLEPDEGREITALAAPEDPRLVKKLLNSLRISHDRIEKAQARGLFPRSEELPDLRQTERLLVVLRETQPDEYQRIAQDPSVLDRDRADEWPELTTADWSSRVRDTIGAAGAISSETAEVLIYGKLPAILHGLPQPGRLVRALRRYASPGLREALVDLSQDQRTRVQRWLCREAGRVNSIVAARRFLGLLMGLAEGGEEARFIAPCLQAVLESGQPLRQVLAEHPQLGALGDQLRVLEEPLSRTVVLAVIEEFLTTDGSSDAQLRFLLATCEHMDSGSRTAFQEWIRSGLQSDEPSDASAKHVSRISRNLPAPPGACLGLAPLAAILAASSSIWEDAEEPEDGSSPVWPRHHFVVILLGDSEEHTSSCLESLFAETGPLGAPKAIGAAVSGVRGAWRTAREMFAKCRDESLQSVFPRLRAWLADQPSTEAIQLILEALGDGAYRLEEAQTGQLATFLASRLMAQPQEQFLTQVVGKRPRAAWRTGWESLAEQTFRLYVDLLADRPDLSAEESMTMSAIAELGWPVASDAERLLLRKIQAPEIPRFKVWLDALVPMVPSGSSGIRSKVLECLDKGYNVDRALLAGCAILWDTEVDPEAAQAIGHYFSGNPKEIPVHGEVWELLREKRGVAAVFEALLQRLPTEPANLIPFRNALELIAGSADLLPPARRQQFLNSAVLGLVEFATPESRALGFELIERAGKPTPKLMKQLRSLRDKGELSKEQEQALSILEGRPDGAVAGESQA